MKSPPKDRETAATDRLLRSLDPWQVVDLLETVLRRGINATLYKSWKRRGVMLIEVPAIRNLMRKEHERRERIGDA